MTTVVIAAGHALIVRRAHFYFYVLATTFGYAKMLIIIIGIINIIIAAAAAEPAALLEHRPHNTHTHAGIADERSACLVRQGAQHNFGVFFAQNANICKVLRARAGAFGLNSAGSICRLRCW